MSIRTLAVAVLAGAVLAAPQMAQAATFTIYTDLAAFNAALSSSSLEDFDDTPFTPGWSIECTNCNFLRPPGVFREQGVTGTRSTWRFNSAITAWGGLFDEAPNGFGRGLSFGVRLDDGFSDVSVPGQVDGFTGQFYGFISDTPFTRVFVGPGVFNGTAISETYNFDDMRFGVAAAPMAGGVPEPAAWALMIGGFGLAGAMLRRRRAVAA